MVAEARARGLELTGPNGFLKLFTKNVDLGGHPRRQPPPMFVAM
jgi:hypothetical protein